MYIDTAYSTQRVKATLTTCSVSPFGKKELADNREGKLSKLRTFLNKKNLYLAKHPGARVELAQRDVEEEARQLKIDEWVKAVSNGCIPELVVDEVGKKEVAELDRCYVIKTELRETSTWVYAFEEALENAGEMIDMTVERMRQRGEVISANPGVHIIPKEVCTTDRSIYSEHGDLEGRF